MRVVASPLLSEHSLRACWPWELSPVRRSQNARCEHAGHESCRQSAALRALAASLLAVRELSPVRRSHNTRCEPAGQYLLSRVRGCFNLAENICHCERSVERSGCVTCGKFVDWMSVRFLTLHHVVSGWRWIVKFPDHQSVLNLRRWDAVNTDGQTVEAYACVVGPVAQSV